MGCNHRKGGGKGEELGRRGLEDKDSNDDIERHNSRLFPISSLRGELTPTLNPMQSCAHHVQTHRASITCNM